MSNITANKQGLKVLIAGAFLQLFLGIIYVWSVFKAPVSEYYGWAASDAGLTASFMLCFFVIGILAGGKAQVKIGVKLTVLTGGLMVAAGMLMTALIPQGELSTETMFSSTLVLSPSAPVFLLYIFYGIIGGFGVGAAYNAIVSSTQKWFPKNRGFATGVSVSAFGFSTVVFAPLVTTLCEKLSVNHVFMILAGIFAAAVLSLFWLIKTPEQMATTAAVPELKGRQYTTLEMLKTPQFFLLTLSLMFGTSVFFIINPDLKDLATTRGIESFATVLVMFTGISNAAGRLCVPFLSDKLGRELADILTLVLTSLGAFCLCFANGIFLIVIIALIAFCYGGYSGLYPVLTSDNFGIKNVGSNYGAIMVGFMLSALLFPIFINRIDDKVLRFIILGTLSAAGAGLVVILRIINSKRK